MSLNHLSRWLELVPNLAQAVKLADTFQENLNVCPPRQLMLAAFETMAPDDVRVVVLGQDPYPTPGKAAGRAFAYHPDYSGPLSSSLKNIVLEADEYGTGFGATAAERSLQHWTDQGVLLLNTRLSVLPERPMSHDGIGWEAPIRSVLEYLAGRDLYWLIWGTEAYKAAHYAGVSPSRMVATSHPCKYSHKRGGAPFTGSGCFRKINRMLQARGLEPIEWVKQA